jgi:hypothetical protein
MAPFFLLGLGLILSCFFTACASDQPAADTNPYHLEQPEGTAHGEVSTAYGRTVGH